MTNPRSRDKKDLECSPKIKKNLRRTDRRDYLREWRYKNREKIREYKVGVYWNDPEKHRKKSRETYHKNKNSTTKGRTNMIMSKKLKGMGHKISPTNIYKLRKVSDIGNPKLIKRLKDEKISINKAYNIVKDENDSYQLEIFRLLEKYEDLENIPNEVIIKTRQQFTNLKELDLK